MVGSQHPPTTWSESLPSLSAEKKCRLLESKGRPWASANAERENMLQSAADAAESAADAATFARDHRVSDLAIQVARSVERNRALSAAPRKRPATNFLASTRSVLTQDRGRFDPRSRSCSAAPANMPGFARAATTRRASGTSPRVAVGPTSRRHSGPRWPSGLEQRPSRSSSL